MTAYLPVLILIFTITNWQMSGKIGPTGSVLVGLLAIWIALLLLSSQAAKRRVFRLFQYFVFPVILYVTVLEPVWFAIAERKLSGDITQIHDGLLQLEIASQRATQGDNPYAIDYFQTRLREWPYRGAAQTNPALYHFAYLPGLVTSHQLLSKLTQPLFGTDDARILFTLAYLGTLITGFFLSSDQKQLVFPVFFGLNPLSVYFLVQGRNDILPFFWILLSVLLARKKRDLLSAVSLGMAVSSKQSSWFLVPFFLIYWLFRPSESSLKSRLGPIALLGLTSLVICGPFILRQPAAFWRSTVNYPLGVGRTSYPILQWSFGLSRLLTLNSAGPNNLVLPYRLVLLVSLGLLFLFLLRRQQMKNTVSNTLTHYGVLLLFFWYLTTYFNDNHLLFIIWIVTAAMVTKEDQLAPD